MDTLVLKLILTPFLIAGVSMAGRRWGPGVSGWLVGLPMTSAPIILYLALDHGTTFAAAASVGILTGTMSSAVFSLVYSRVAFHRPWPVSEAISFAAFLALTWVFEQFTLPLWLLVPILAAVLIGVLWLIPKPSQEPDLVDLPWWDLPARIIIATIFVLLLTEMAPRLGPHLSGLLAPFPIFSSILGIFNQHFHGPAAAARFFRGIVLGLFAYSTFFLVVALVLPHLALGLTFAIAVVLTLLVQRVSLELLSPGTVVEPE